MKHKTIFALGLVALTLLLSNCLFRTEEKADNVPTISQAERVKRGEYLVNAVGCDDCHTPKVMTNLGPVPDSTRRFMGHPATEPFASDEVMKKLVSSTHVGIFSSGFTATVGDWGVSYAANLTPDDTGIGNWTEEQFFKAIREGKSKGLDGTRDLLPPMPWPVYRNFSDDDLKAIFAYLKSQKPIQNVVPNPKAL